MTSLNNDTLLPRLIQLLNLSSDESETSVSCLAQLTKEQFEAWKPHLESIAQALDPQAEEIAELLVQVGTATQQPALHALSLWFAGNMYYLLRKHKAAHEKFTQAASIYRIGNDLLNLARMSVAWVHTLSELAYYQQAFTLVAEAEEQLKISDQIADQRRLSGLYRNAGVVYENTGQLLEALECYERRWRVYHPLIGITLADTLEAVKALNSIGVVQILLGQYSQAEQSFTQAQNLLSSTEAPPNRPQNQPQLPINSVQSMNKVWVETLLLMNIAWLETLRNRPLKFVRKAFTLARTNRVKLDPQSALHAFAFIDLDEANWLIHCGAWQEVNRANLEKLEMLTAKAGLFFETTYAKLLLGQLMFYGENAEQASAYFEQIGQEAGEQNPAFAYLAHMWQARALRKQGAMVAARHALETGIQYVEQTRKRLTVDDYRAGYLDDKLVAYQDLVSLHIEMGDIEAALRVSEQAKARTLTEMLSVQVTGQSNAQAEPPSIQQIAALLHNDTLAISYVVVHESIWAFLIDHDGLVTQPYQLAGALNRTKLESALSLIQQILFVSSPTSAQIVDCCKQAQQVLQSWFADYLAPFVDKLARYTNLLIVPDGILNALPFAALYNPQQQCYLVETHCTTLAPSLTIATLLATKAIHTKVEHAAMVTTKATTNALIVGNSSMGGVRGKLPRVIDEARQIATYFTSPFLLLEEVATFVNFCQTALTADFIYLATHGEYHPAAPASSLIELADQPLRVADLLKLRLSASIVILSGCETGKGQMIGNEMMGLVRAFLYTGARSVVGNYWPVDDVATYALMQGFIQQVTQGKSLAQSLQATQCHFIQAKDTVWSHPFFWGASTLFGIDGWLAA